MNPKLRDSQIKRKLIPADACFREWKKDPRYIAAYEALHEGFVFASVFIEARGNADMTQEDVAAAMGTTQAVVARLECGKVLPSARRLESFVRATRTKLRISVESSQERWP